MIDRYNDPRVSRIFDWDSKYESWRLIELDALQARSQTGDESAKAAYDEALLVPVPNFNLIDKYEMSSGHDVVGFLTAWTATMTPRTASQIHMGLTSSDLVDNTLFGQLSKTVRLYWRDLESLDRRLEWFKAAHIGTHRVGRTHGQWAEPTILAARFMVWQQTVAMIRSQTRELDKLLRVTKSPGAVGTMRLFGLPAAQHLADIRKTALVQSTQVIPRQRVLAWAGWVLQIVSLVEEIALEIRLSSRSEVGEMREGATDRRVGSSAVPGKLNPIGSEQLSGLGRVARAQFAAIAETAGALHHERDISNSSVERTSLVDLATLTGYMLTQIGRILDDLKIYPDKMFDNFVRASDSAYVQWRLQQLGVPYIEASGLAHRWSILGGWDVDMINHINSFRDSGDQIDMTSLLAHLHAPIE